MSTRVPAGLLASFLRVQRVCGAQWSLSDLLLATQWPGGSVAGGVAAAAAQQGAFAARGSSTAAAAAQAAAAAPPDSSATAAPTASPPHRTPAAKKPPRRPATAASEAGSAIVELARGSRGRALGRSAGAAGAGDALDASRPISESALMTAIHEAEQLSDIERLLLDHGAYFRCGVVGGGGGGGCDRRWVLGSKGDGWEGET